MSLVLIEVHFMNIECIFNHQSYIQDKNTAKKTAIVIDVLRASSTIITALDNGACAIIPCSEIASARAIAADTPNSILSGERNGLKIEGFDIGNSPKEFNVQTVQGKTIVSSTTNGTCAIAAVSEAREILIGALLNSKACAKQVVENNTEDLLIACAGTYGQPSLDDILAAGAIISNIIALTVNEPILNDAAKIALITYQRFQGKDMLSAFKYAKHGQTLINVGREEDLVFCAAENSSQTVPYLDKTTNRLIKKT